MTETELLTTFADPGKTQFLSRLAVSHNRNKAADAAGLKIEQVLRWLSHDPRFKAAVTEIESLAAMEDFMLPSLISQVQKEMRRIGMSKLEIQA